METILCFRFVIRMRKYYNAEVLMILSFSLSDFVRSGSEINARMPWLTQRLLFFYSILVLVFKGKVLTA